MIGSVFFVRINTVFRDIDVDAVGKKKFYVDCVVGSGEMIFQ